MGNLTEFFKQLSFLWEGGSKLLLLVGINVLAANLLWLLVNLLYGEVLVYNLQEGKQYHYMGSFWIERKGGEYILFLPKKLIEKSYTTQYKLCLGRGFVKLHKGKAVCIHFGSEYRIFVPMEREIIAKNHVATSRKL